jgi:hypothetical protein
VGYEVVRYCGYDDVAVISVDNVCFCLLVYDTVIIAGNEIHIWWVAVVEWVLVLTDAHCVSFSTLGVV